MANQNIGDQINRIVTDALDSMDFHKLNRDINATVKARCQRQRKAYIKSPEWTGKIRQKPTTWVPLQQHG